MQRLLIAFMLVGLTVGSALAKTVYVNGAAGDDKWDGAAASRVADHGPVRTLAHGMSLMQTGDTLDIMKTDLPYRESLTVAVGGTAAQPVIIDGHGATLSGGDPVSPERWTAANGVFYCPVTGDVKFLWDADGALLPGKTPAALGDKQWCVADGRLWFRPASGKRPSDYALEIAVRDCGVKLIGAGNVIVRNLRCTHFWNDGFNIHSSSAPVWFENISADHNGDQGFSAHENCEVYVRNGNFSFNQTEGITDVNFARSHYDGVTIHGNLRRGIFFIGGMHSVTDADITGSPVNFGTAAGDWKQMPNYDRHPLRETIVNLRNVTMHDEARQNLVVGAGTKVVAEHCRLDGGDTGAEVNGTLYLLNSIIANAKEWEISAAGIVASDYNLFFPGRFKIGDRQFFPAQWEEYRKATGGDAHSALAKPEYIGDSGWLTAAVAALVPAYGGESYGGFQVGPVPRTMRPQIASLPMAALRGAPAAWQTVCDFESADVWNRLYFVPEQEGQWKPVGEASRSTEQAAVGKSSGKVHVTWPAGGKHWELKLFSQQLPLQNFRAVRFRLYGDGSGAGLTFRVRDRDTENFSYPLGKMDWKGWREITIDLCDKGVTVAGGDGNGIVDGPPVEFVLHISHDPGVQPENMTVYIDQLEVETVSPVESGATAQPH